jgi:hypothetical protein
MHTPSDWQAWLLRQARHYAVCEADANDLVQDCLHAYQRRFGRYPWEHAHTREAIQHARCWCQQKIHSLAVEPVCVAQGPGSGEAFVPGWFLYTDVPCPDTVPQDTLVLDCPPTKNMVPCE